MLVVKNWEVDYESRESRSILLFTGAVLPLAARSSCSLVEICAVCASKL